MRRCFKSILGWLLPVIILLNYACSNASQIRLRNATIDTSQNKSLAAVSPQPLKTNALYIVQFNTPLTSEQISGLKQSGIELLRYIPDNGYVARINNQKSLIGNKLIQWVGEYLPEYKVDKRLIKNNIINDANNYLQLKIQLAPGLNLNERLMLIRLIDSIEGESPLRFGSIINCKIQAKKLNQLLNLASVLWVEPAPKMRLYDEVSTKIVAGETGVAGSYAAVHQLGFDGRGVTVAVADSGLNNGDAQTMHPDLFGRVDDFFYYGNLTDAADEHSHGTHVTGIIAGNASTGEKDENGYLYGLGVAPAAHIVAQRIFDGVGNYEPPPTFEVLTRDAVNSGAVIGSNSWGDDTQGRYDLSAAEFDALVRDANAMLPGDQQYILEFSAGNAGPGSQTIGSPAVAKNVIATGATESSRADFILYGDGPDVIADFSSRGPCEDGRIKPDVVAPGTWIASCQSESATDEYAWAPISANYQYQGGTSQAGPHVSGAAAVFVQYYRQINNGKTPSPALVKAALINSAIDLDDETGGTDPTPNNDEGWGRVDLTQLIGSDIKYDFLDQTVLIQTGQEYEKRIVIASDELPLKITLAYTDVPGLPAAIPALVNDLDLTVIAPDGRIYRGNQFDNGESIPDTPNSDNINNVEAVHISTPKPGVYIVKVVGKNIAEDARQETPVIDQDFALVISGDLATPGVGVLFFDKSAYTAPSTAMIKLYDLDLAQQSSVSIKITSDTEPSGEIINLYPSDFSGLFTGKVSIVTGSAQVDGKLQVSHGNTITAIYQDASPPSTQIATAIADLQPPMINNVTVINQYGKAFIRWQSDEPVTGIVIYGTNSLNFSKTNYTLSSNPTVELANLNKNTQYKFLIIAIDDAGNVSTNNNGGAYFNFVATPPATMLLVDAYYPFPSDPSPVIPLSEYTDPLNQAGINYEVWDVNKNGLPTTNDLAVYRVVFWRVNDSLWGGLVGYAGLTAAEQNLLKTYVKGGGSLLLSSMELLSRMGTSAISLDFRSNVLQVVSFNEDAGVSAIEGSPYDSISSGIDLGLDYSNYDSDFWELIGQTTDVSDTLIISTNAAPIFFDSASGDVVGLKSPRFGQANLGRVVFLSFPFDAVPKSGYPPNNRANLIRNLLSFLAPGANGIGTITLDNPAYTVPSRVQVELADSDLEGMKTVTVKAFTTVATNGILVTLNETIRPGMFLGSFILSTNLTDSSLPARNGDLVWVEYFDASANSVVRVAADVDTQPAIISNIEVEPDYEQATIYWETDEPADSLVQFGESTFLGRTGYRSDLKTTHIITINGLQPGRKYYFQIVSRDSAGNSTIDDNNGALYTFETLTPIYPPYFNNFDTGSSNGWTVYTGEESETEWSIDIPDNGYETSANSPPYAWGSNIRGSAIDTADTFLISPAIQLTGGNKATLKFWHSYDFTERSEFDIIELGRLVIITNQLSDPIVVNEYYDSSGGWIEEEIDLTPCIGRVIYVVWQYQLLSLDIIPRPGWLIDDVSITVTNLPMGNIIVSNNLNQARFSVTGTANYTGSGKYTVFTNCPLGQYIINYYPVQFYQTPISQTNYLTENQPLIFNGNYSFADSNQNGISDEWEQYYFGSLINKPDSDADGDGMSNYGEFIAGTNPNDSASSLSIKSAVVFNDRIAITISTAPGHGYRILTSQDFVNWTIFSDWTRATSNSTTISAQLTTNKMFYKVEVQP
ncbi:MAG: S8 family serine peptidase [Verrucomicrobiia bacterium]